jgi:hypothetical protein
VTARELKTDTLTVMEIESLAVSAESDLLSTSDAPVILRLIQEALTLRGVNHRVPDAYIQCGNRRHPRGPWHSAASIPGSWEWAECFIQWLRRRRFGCGCQP